MARLQGLCATLLWLYQVNNVISQCSGDFQPISASEFTAQLQPGWNLGNTLDAFPNEDSWNNVPVVAGTFDDVKAFGFNSVRIPVTWMNHFIGFSDQGDSPDWTVDPEWLQRVANVVDMATSRDLYVIINVHHDSHFWADLTVANANYSMIEEKFYRLWYQIGTKLACTPSLVAFEPLNEAPGDTAEIAAEQNKLNNIFLQAINDAGGFNSKRVVTLSGPGQDIVRTSLWFEPPDSKYTNPWALQVHYYNPYDFTSAAWGKTIWGSSVDLAAFETDFSRLHDNFTDVPIVVGEWLVSPVHSEPAARWRYYDIIGRLSRKYDFAPIVWDTGNDLLDRSSHTWYDATGLNLHFNALAGNLNALPDSTLDTTATSQFSSAFVFHKVGTAVESVSLSFTFNGDSVQSITTADGASLTLNSDYTVNETEITLFVSFLSPYFDVAGPSGIKTTLLVSFASAPSIPIQVVQWDTPTLPLSSTTATSASNIDVEVNWNSVGKPATVAAFKSDGTPLMDEWTVVLPPLQRGRTTLGSGWGWSWGQQGVTIATAAVSAAIQSGMTTTFMLESYPRVLGNYANFTLALLSD
ncbi:endoglucanase B [Colletotrichum tamarilloi]|uniref:Endoglucanase B n=1 Tax=Colletotrichum tamarilloi TaxID=1209934 RepID=A0ABQ9R7Y6_9PEZI|nr:endoglucanase B [Colletotrichum tamarilloi]KAK1497226.1 endoglucanase B [Colletotrichum tamarilloi]